MKMEKMDNNTIFIEMKHDFSKKFVPNTDKLEHFIENKIINKILEYPHHKTQIKEILFIPDTISIIKTPNPMKSIKKKLRTQSIGYIISLKYIGLPQYFQEIFILFEQILMKNYPNFTYNVFYNQNYLQ